MKRYNYLMALLIALLPLSAPRAQEPALYSLEQCKQMALASNADVRTAENNLLAAIETRREAFTKYFPEVAGGMTYFRANRDILEYTIPDLITLGLIDRGKGAGVWALQPILAGGQIINGNKLAKVSEEVARIKREQSGNSVVLQTEALYWQLATLKAERLTVEAAVAMLDSLTRQVQVAVDAGVTTRNDLLKAELQRNSYRATLVDLDNGIELLRMLLSQQVGLGTTSTIDIREQVPAELPAMPYELLIATDEALPLTPDHQLLLKALDAKRLEKRIAIGQNLPQLGLGGGWFYHDLLKQNHNFGAVMLTLSVPVSAWWGGSHAIKQKSLALQNARIELDNLSQKLEIGMTDKWNSLTAAHRKMALAQESIAQSRENLRLNTLYYEAGTSTITDLLDAQMLFQRSQADYIASYGAFRLAVAQYLNATGRLK